MDNNNTDYKTVDGQLHQVVRTAQGQTVLIPAEVNTVVLPTNKPIITDMGAVMLAEEEKYLFQMPSNANNYNIALGGFAYLRDYSLDSGQQPTSVVVTSDQFPDQTIGLLRAINDPLQQFAYLVASNPHIITRVNINASTSAQAANGLKLYVGVNQKGVSLGAPANVKIVNGQIPEQGTMNQDATTYNIPGGFLINARNFIVYNVNANTTLSFEVYVRRVISLDEVAGSVIKNVGR